MPKQLPTRRLATAAATLAALLLPFAATAQPAAPTPYQRSIAAGYKALMLCGAIFNGGRTQAQAEALELTGIYPEYDAIVPTLKAEVRASPAGAAPSTAEVIVPFDARLPPRRAVWARNTGCTILPIGGIGDRHPPLDPPRFAGSLDDRPWPMGERGVAPRTPAALQAPIERAFAGAFSGRTTGVMILRDGQPIAEHYADGFGPHIAQRTWSVAKSISGTLIGIGVRDRLVDVRTTLPLVRLDRRGTIRLDHLLRMASGLHDETAGNRTDALYFGGTTVDEELNTWQLEAEPGTRFRYANNDIVLAVRTLRTALRDDDRYRAFPRTELFAKLGMTRTVAELDWGGNFVLSSQVFSTARDLARLGQFWLQDGVWNGERILPQGWMRTMTTPSGPQPTANDGWGYGATLWLAGPAQHLPPGTYSAQGNRGQFIVVVPSKKLVIVRRGEDKGGAGFDIAKFAAEVVAALP